MSDWAKKLRTIRHEPTHCYNSQDLGHREHCMLMCGYRDDECDCESSEIFEIAQGAAKHIEIVEEYLEDIIKDLKSVKTHPQHTFLFDACIDDLKTLLEDDTKPLYKPKS